MMCEKNSEHDQLSENGRVQQKKKNDESIWLIKKTVKKKKHCNI